MGFTPGLQGKAIFLAFDCEFNAYLVLKPFLILKVLHFPAMVIGLGKFFKL